MENNNQLPQIITLSGDPGAGKSTLVKELKRIYEEKGFLVEPHLVSHVFRQLADKLGISMTELNKQSALRPEVDRMVDNEIKELSKTINSNFSANTVHIFDSRMAWKFVDNSFSVRLTIPSYEGGKRIFLDTSRNQSDRYLSMQEAIEETEIRKQEEIKKYKRLYGVDLSDLNNYQLVIDTQNAKPEEIAKLIFVTSNLHQKGKFFPKMWQGNGSSVIPSKMQPQNKLEEMQR